MSTGTFNNTTLIAGPAILRFPGTPAVDVISEGDIQERIVRETWQPRTSLHGAHDTRLTSQHVELSFSPSGDAPGFTKCAVPTYGPADIGKSIMQAGPFIVQTAGGQRVSYDRFALTRPAEIILAASATLNGACTIACLHKNNEELVAVDALNTITSGALTVGYTGDYEAASRRWRAAFGAVNMHVEGPIRIQITPEVEIKKLEAFGAVDIYLKSLQVTARFKPADLTEADVYNLMKVQGSTAVLPGQSLAKAGDNLVFTELVGSSPKTATIFAAGISGGGLEYGDVTNRDGELEFISRHRFTGAAPQALWSFSLV